MYLLTALAAVAAHYGAPADIWGAILKDFSNITQPTAFAAFLQVLMIDLVLAGDNAIVVGALAAGLTADQRRKVILIGVLAALLLRIIFALVVTQLLEIIGLILVGGLLLLWVAWKMWRELRHQGESVGSEEIVGDEHSGLRPARSFGPRGARCETESAPSGVGGRRAGRSSIVRSKRGRSMLVRPRRWRRRSQRPRGRWVSPAST